MGKIIVDEKDFENKEGLHDALKYKLDFQTTMGKI